MTTYNGWTNYETWRVNIELFDGIDAKQNGWPSDIKELADTICCYAEDVIFVDSSEGLARDYALAFLSDVNWREIAEHIIANYAEA